MEKRLSDKVAIVTGASKGIGKAIAKLYAGEGARVLGVFLSDTAAAQKTLEEIQAAGGQASLFQGDVSNMTDTERMASEAIRLYGRIDILCSNAGIYPSVKIKKMTEEDWDRMQAVNLKGTFLTVKACLPQMQAQKYGKIITIASTTGVRTGISGFAHYGAAKAGIIGFIRSACLELAPYNITINAVAPGIVLTEGFKGELGDARDTIIQKIGQEIPMKRLAEPLDIAYAVLFLSTDESRYITGQEIIVDGGLVLPELPLQLLGS
ncbi:MAG: SDR family oxidoreductase [Candidatus Tectomicrobia bacterium]|uniref:SDR family oxidoreductase n=1 Tax=Tectimicrobiota bacterium TaxID=2528274 RepID=A0A933GL98_UNCTE|nr:SDR family oxidoreductase [Candidatus Tectomicrobia bacterium]